ncbi:hypothetical protein SAMN05216223_13119 [Actinacidiphila yanglinensis]|uniref:Uncharacterized protein n=1 Tax=Actinacidiphila yanglinensis TaxID=310779 RepID=A0A1H6EAN0_9ACTN|nr:hypothetical protein SAMN05216223_13119 [Actinacidiphila yanglinensis]
MRSHCLTDPPTPLLGFCDHRPMNDNRDRSELRALVGTVAARLVYLTHREMTPAFERLGMPPIPEDAGSKSQRIGLSLRQIPDAGLPQVARRILDQSDISVNPSIRFQLERPTARLTVLERFPHHIPLPGARVTLQTTTSTPAPFRQIRPWQATSTPATREKVAPGRRAVGPKPLLVTGGGRSPRNRRTSPGRLEDETGVRHGPGNENVEKNVTDEYDDPGRQTATTEPVHPGFGIVRPVSIGIIWPFL